LSAADAFKLPFKDRGFLVEYTMSTNPAPFDSGSAEPERVFLESDDEIKGQKFVCLSFLTPTRELVRSKELFFYSEFLKFHAMDFRIKSTESFIFDRLREIQNVLADVVVDMANTDVGEAATGVKKELVERIEKAREKLARENATAVETHVKANLRDYRETTIVEDFEKYMVAHQERLEEEFHKANNFRTTKHGLKIRGTYSTHEQAVARAKALHKKDPYFNVYVAEVGEWLPWDPDPDSVQDSEYANDDLNKLMRKYKENQAEKEVYFEEMKRKKMAEAARATMIQKEQNAAAAAAIGIGKGVEATGKPKVAFGEQEQIQEGADAAKDMFAGEDLALRRKREAANTIQHST
jgi:hypothetical protein